MGITAELYRVKPSTLAAFVDNPMAFMEEDGWSPAFESLGAVDLDKLWHDIEYLLNVKNPSGVDPFYIDFLGCHPVSGVPDDYGDVRFCEPDEVRVVAAKLRKVSGSRLWKRFDASHMAMYQFAKPEWMPRRKQGILTYYSLMRNFYIDAADDGDGMVICLG